MSRDRELLSDRTFRDALIRMVMRKVPETDAEDIVQSTLAEALASQSVPDNPDALRRWVWGIARHKIVDFYRRTKKEQLDFPEIAAEPAPHAEQDLLRWAERELPPGKDAQATFDWMLREGEGEKLESIAESEHLPPPRVRQRVSRLRRHLKSRWAKQVAALAAVGVLVILLVYILRKKEQPSITQDAPSAPLPSQIVPQPSPQPLVEEPRTSPPDAGPPNSMGVPSPSGSAPPSPPRSLSTPNRSTKPSPGKPGASKSPR